MEVVFAASEAAPNFAERDKAKYLDQREGNINDQSEYELFKHKKKVSLTWDPCVSWAK